MGRFQLDPAQLALMPEGEVFLTIRPEHIRVGAPPGPNTVSGTLTACIFVGTHTRCKVTTAAAEIEALKGVDSLMLREGGAIHLHFPPEHLWLFPRGKAT
jgi:iron(III) transport system ATP-binding protein